MPYEQEWSTANPGCLMFLVDQSSTMNLPALDGWSRKDLCAYEVNTTIDNVRSACQEGNRVFPRVHIGIVGYPPDKRFADDEGILFPSATQGPAGYALSTVDEFVKFASRDANGTPEWIKGYAHGKTPMHLAFETAARLAKCHVKVYPHSYPPVIINITDGEADDLDLAGKAARALLSSKDTRTSDGLPLLFNVHVTTASEASAAGPTVKPTLVFPHEPPADPWAKFLFDITSPIPDLARDQANHLLSDRAPKGGFPVGCRGLVFGTDRTVIHTLLRIGSRTQ